MTHALTGLTHPDPTSGSCIALARPVAALPVLPDGPGPRFSDRVAGECPHRFDAHRQEGR